MRRKFCLVILLLFIAVFLRQASAAELNFGFGQMAESWFQVQGGDVHADGNINSPVPATLNFMENPQGVVSFGGSGSFGEGAPNWQVQDSSIDLSAFNYNYFSSHIATTDFPCNPSESSCWANLGSGNYQYSGTMNMPGSTININSRTIVVLVNGGLNINEKIRVADDAFLAFIVNGSINIDGDVTETGINPALEGIYFSQGTIATGESDKEFVGKGIFAAQGGFNLQRDLGDTDNQTTPAETFIFDPRLLVEMPEALQKATMSWTEIAP
jgi:hypothetical protein